MFQPNATPKPSKSSTLQSKIYVRRSGKHCRASKRISRFEIDTKQKPQSPKIICQGRWWHSCFRDEGNGHQTRLQIEAAIKWIGKPIALISACHIWFRALWLQWGHTSCDITPCNQSWKIIPWRLHHSFIQRLLNLFNSIKWTIYLFKG